MTTTDLKHLSNIELLTATAAAAGDERRATADLLALLGEVDARRLYLGEGCSSLFAYCTRVLHLSEHAAYHRIEAARAARQYPVILARLSTGELTLTAVALLRPHLTAENHEALLEAARHKTKRDVEYQIACLAPRPDAKALIRRISDQRMSGDVVTSGPAGASADSEPTALASSDTTEVSLCDARHLARAAAPATPRPAVAPLASDRFLLRVTLSADAHGKLRRAQDLMRHTIPDGDPGAILGRALTLLVNQLEKGRTAKTGRPRLTSSERNEQSGSSRYISAAIKRAVWTRDEGRCAFVGNKGRCTETGSLEYHHVIPFARGGQTSASNIALRCRAHNQFESELVFGRWPAPVDTQTRSGPS